ncbi:hypothetical protein HDU85_000932 [Gaertneriomyces sp. JEL0708]|nr:hypothetical protein HDU85_000932 [Gaertneriomyces sp. JEL0708]
MDLSTLTSYVENYLPSVLQSPTKNIIDVLPHIPVKPTLSIVFYFTALITLLVATFSRAIKRSFSSFAAFVYTYLAFGALYITWRNILVFIADDWGEYYSERLVTGSANAGDWGLVVLDYLRDSDWFVKAYVAVTEDRWRWWWSSQLLGCACVVAVVMWSEGAHRWVKSDGASVGVKAGVATALTFLVVGLLGAMSVCFALFLAQRDALIDDNVLRTAPRLTTTTVLCFALYTLLISITYYIPTTSLFFTYNLAIIHLLLLLPLASVCPKFITHLKAMGPEKKTRENITRSTRLASLYAFLAGANLITYIQSTIPLFGGAHMSALPDSTSVMMYVTDKLEATLWTHPCQTSISFDYLCIVMIGAVLVVEQSVRGVMEGKIGVWRTVGAGVVAMVGTMVVGASVTLPAWLCWREGWIRRGGKVKRA